MKSPCREEWHFSVEFKTPFQREAWQQEQEIRLAAKLKLGNTARLDSLQHACMRNACALVVHRDGLS